MESKVIFYFATSGLTVSIPLIGCGIARNILNVIKVDLLQ
jgi:hypothetical protein